MESGALTPNMGGSLFKGEMWTQKCKQEECHMEMKAETGVMFLQTSFHQSSVGKESACNAGVPGSIPGSGRSTGEGIGYPLQYSWASLVAQLVKNLPAMGETPVRSLGWEDPLEKGMATHSSILAWRSPWTGVAKSWTGLSDFLFIKQETATVAANHWILGEFQDRCSLRAPWEPTLPAQHLDLRLLVSRTARQSISVI